MATKKSKPNDARSGTPASVETVMGDLVRSIRATRATPSRTGSGSLGTRARAVRFRSTDFAADVRSRNLRHISALAALMASPDAQQSLEECSNEIRCDVFCLLHRLAEDASIAQELLDEQDFANAKAYRENGNG